MLFQKSSVAARKRVDPEFNKPKMSAIVVATFLSPAPNPARAEILSSNFIPSFSFDPVASKDERLFLIVFQAVFKALGIAIAICRWLLRFINASLSSFPAISKSFLFPSIVPLVATTGARSKAPPVCSIMSTIIEAAGEAKLINADFGEDNILLIIS